ncbi:MAG: hypothetical protein NZ937_02590 [Armatimonadetes bacterium]|nr:hypothetical protein [Armatimonadota bacterium]
MLSIFARQTAKLVAFERCCHTKVSATFGSAKVFNDLRLTKKSLPIVFACYFRAVTNGQSFSLFALSSQDEFVRARLLPSLKDCSGPQMVRLANQQCKFHFQRARLMPCRKFAM